MDAVIKPEHYQRGGIETIDVIRAKLGPQGFGFYCEGNVLKYLTRWRDKNGLEDLRKAQVYLQWLVTESELQVQPLPAEVSHHAIAAPMPPFEATLPPNIEALMDRGDEDAPTEGLKAGEAMNPVSQADEE